MKKRKLQSANSILSQLEPGGGFTSSTVRYSAEESNPDGFVATTSNDSIVDVVSMEELEALSTEPEIISIVSRIHSYIAITPKTFSTFATMGLDSSNPSYDDIENKEAVDDLIRDAWISNQKLFWGTGSGFKNINTLLGKLYTYGIVYGYVIRKLGSNEVTGYEFSVLPVTKKKNEKREDVLETPAGNIVREDDIFNVRYSDIDQHAYSYIGYIRPQFNLYRAVERTRVANAIMSAMFRSIYTVPTTKLTKNKAKARLSTIYGKWKRDVRIDMSSGKVTVNGKADWQVNTELWASETSSGKPNIENPSDGNPALANMDLVQYWNKKFYKLSKLPLSKYEAVDMSYLGDISSNDEDERQFDLFISSNRTAIGTFLTQLVIASIKDSPLVSKIIDDLEYLVGMTWFDEISNTKLADELKQIDDNLDQVNNVTTKVREIMDLSVDDIPELLAIDGEIGGLQMDLERLEMASILSASNSLKSLTTKKFKSKLQDILDAKDIDTDVDPNDDPNATTDGSDVMDDTEAQAETEAIENRGSIIAKFMKSSNLGKPLPAMEDDWGDWGDWDDESFDDEGSDFDDESDAGGWGDDGDSGSSGFDTGESLDDAEVEEVDVDDLAQLLEDQIDRLKELVLKKIEVLKLRRKMQFDKLQRTMTKRMVGKYVPSMLSMTTVFAEMSDLSPQEISKDMINKEIAKAKRAISRRTKTQKVQDDHIHSQNIKNISKANQDIKDQDE